MGKHFKLSKIENGQDMVDFYHYTCSYCHKDISEMEGIIELEDDYLCRDCLKNLFFKVYDVYSLPFMKEIDGKLWYTSKALGKRPKIPALMREKVFKRDDYQCKGCGEKDKRRLSVDHIKPFVHGGKDVFSNFQTLCRSCNSKKGAKL